MNNEDIKKDSIDLKIIKKKYGEKMMLLCRELFPTLIETNGLLSKLMLDNFEPTRFLYDDIIKYTNIDDFYFYIMNLIIVPKGKFIETNLTPSELLDSVGYNLYECKTEEDIQSFKKYYQPKEELCTFRDQEGRLTKWYVFFAVKKNVDEIKREMFSNPNRQDDYGTSVISIQFKRGDTNILSIKNRYNHAVTNPDATFLNNLENIVPGLTKSFEKVYGLNILQNQNRGFELLNYVEASDRKYYKYNYYINNIYYCPNNVIIDDLEVKRYDSERYLVVDYFIIDLKEKTIKLYDESIDDCFINQLKNINKISVTVEGDYKNIHIITHSQNEIIIKIDNLNRIIGYKNNEIEKVEDNMLYYNTCLQEIELNNVVNIGDNFLYNNEKLCHINFPKLSYAGDFFVPYNHNIKTAIFNNLKKCGKEFIGSDKALEYFYSPELEEVEDYFLASSSFKIINLPKLRKLGKGIFKYNFILESCYTPNLDKESLEVVKQTLESNDNINFTKKKSVEYDLNKAKLMKVYNMGLISKSELETKINKLK